MWDSKQGLLAIVRDPQNVSESYCYITAHHNSNKANIVCIHVTLMRILATIVTVEKQ